ncbi:MAG: ABC transporter substrate-binding protein [Bacteroidales bacterium]|nr:ABC transporter substrate-binding protein [Bacteroidales bacterium]MBQ1842604.1 ABC transporter substrate-binding protein [Bacteroidales bacterium]
MRRLFIAAAALLAAISCSSDRSGVLKVYNWSDYIGEGIISEFEQWYKEQTGEDITVVYQTFDVNETMLSKIEKGHEDYDVVCPSDYIIERMLNSGLLLPLDFASIPDSINYIAKNRSPYIEKMFREINPEIDANDYSVAYMWGTTGIIYNTKYVTDEEASTWDVISNPKFKDQVLIKDAPRDVYGPVLIYLKQKELKEGKVTLQELMGDSSDESIAAVEEYLKSAKDNVLGWEADFGKDQMTKGRGVLSLNWSGDAVWAIEEAAAVGVDLKYVVPEEGSTVWFDGWVIPKYAKNVKAATYFIDFMCRTDIAIRNMDETGYVASNGAWEVLESQIDEEQDAVDLSYFFGEGADSVHVDGTLYPDKAVIERCALEHDWGADTDKLLAMWSRVKGDNANSMTYIIIGALLLAIIAAAAVSAHKKRARHSSKRRRR